MGLKTLVSGLKSSFQKRIRKFDMPARIGHRVRLLCFALAMVGSQAHASAPCSVTGTGTVTAPAANDTVACNGNISNLDIIVGTTNVDITLGATANLGNSLAPKASENSRNDNSPKIAKGRNNGRSQIMLYLFMASGVTVVGSWYAPCQS